VGQGDRGEEIEALNEWIYGDLQNGVYRAGFARSQEAYDEAFDGVFAALERLEALLGGRRYLTGDRLTLADWRLFPTLVRDVVYHTQPGVADTVAMDQIREHYYTTHDSLNPKRIIPRGPLDLDFTT
jgi:putative glutathione S-transferase